MNLDVAHQLQMDKQWRKNILEILFFNVMDCLSELCVFFKFLFDSILVI